MSSSLSALLKRSTINDHDEVVKACNTALKQSKNDLDAQHIKAVALLKLDRFEDALRLFEDGGDRLKAIGQLEYAYALYKTGNLQVSRRVSTSLESRGAKHVEAQASYRLEDFQPARELYTRLSKDGEASGEENDLRINGSATDAQLEWKRQGYLASARKARREDLEAFETAYNAACACIARGELAQGNILLKRAKDLCASSAELNEDEKKTEALPISVQQAYVMSALGKMGEATALLQEIDTEEITDLSTRQFARVNRLLAPSETFNPYLAHRIFHALPAIPQKDKAFEFQESIMKQNELAIDLLSSKFNGVVRSTDRYLSEQSLPTISPVANKISAANVAGHAQNKLGKSGLRTVLPLLDKRPNDVGLLLTIIHLYMLTRNHGAAVRLLEDFLKRLDGSESTQDQDVRYAPGLIALLVSLYSIERRKTDIRGELVKAASYWRHKSKSSPSLLREAGLSLLQSGHEIDYQEARDIFRTLHSETSNDKLATAGLVAAYATSDPSKVAKEAKLLTAIGRLTAEVDVTALEKAGMPQAAATASSILSRKRPAADDGKVVKKRVRKSRLPKDFDPVKKSDPERWLPLRDRSTYKPKGKKGKQKQATATQGGGVNERAVEGLNASNEMARAQAVSGNGGGGVGKSKKKKPKK